MPFIKVDQENSSPIELYYEDHGNGPPVILIHGWPLSGASWEKQTSALLEAGFRVITYDRRGFGKSSQPTTDYDYDTFSEDLNTLLNELKLQDVTLIGFSMGSGEVTRYLGRFGSEKVQRAILIGVIPPYLLKTQDNPEGVDQKVFTQIENSLRQDRPAYLTEFFQNFYNLDVFLGKKISEEVVRLSWMVASQASPWATIKCVSTWTEDFREDLKNFDIPTLIIHGTEDRILPIDATARRLQKSLPDARIVEIEGAPHGLLWTHAEVVNQEILKFLQASVPKSTKARASSQKEEGRDLNKNPLH